MNQFSMSEETPFSPHYSNLLIDIKRVLAFYRAYPYLVFVPPAVAQMVTATTRTHIGCAEQREAHRLRAAHNSGNYDAVGGVEL
ncbi:MAG: hypothetical protein RLZ92_899 [Pseudomonadota bacterium]|jgi:hypothetical protein